MFGIFGKKPLHNYTLQVKTRQGRKLFFWVQLNARPAVGDFISLPHEFERGAFRAISIERVQKGELTGLYRMPYMAEKTGGKELHPVKMAAGRPA